MPTRVKSRFFDSNAVSTPTFWPTCTFAVVARDLLMTISSSACGARPSRSCSRSLSPVQFSPSCGGPNELTTLPLLPITRAPSAFTMPVAEATPGTCFTRSTRAAGRGAEVCSPSISLSSTFGFAATFTSISEKPSAKTESKERPSVSVSTKAPDTNMTPSTTASPDRISRTLRASRLFSVARNISCPPQPECPASSWCPAPSRRSARSAPRRSPRRRGRPPGRRTRRRSGRG